MNKTLTKKLIYVIAALTLLALLIPAMAVPVSADTNPNAHLDMTINGTVVDGPVAGFPNEAFNASGSIVTITAHNFTPTSWALTGVTSVYEDPVQYAAASWYPATPAPNAQSVQVQGTWGAATVTANYTSPSPGSLSVTKKWGMLDETIIGIPQSKQVTWNEGSKSFYATGNVTDIVMGDFVVNGNHVNMAMQGMKLNWYLISGDKAIDMTPDLPGNLKTRFASDANYPKAQFVQFVDPTVANWLTYNQWHHEMATPSGWLGTYVSNFSDNLGKANVHLGAWFEEVVQVVVVPEYPADPSWSNKFVVPEVTSINFDTYEYESVPQVRWAGEKIVLEANFGKGINTSGEVLFYFQNQSVGTLEGITDDSEARTVWTTVDPVTGIASAILTSNVSGQADVVAALYPHGRGEAMTNQQSFRVYFLNFYSLTLRDVYGKRSGHNSGVWQPANPYSSVFPAPRVDTDPNIDNSDMLTQTANVSQDLLERAQVRGWFMPAGAQKSTRGEARIDLNANGNDSFDVTVAAGHYVLPDDWVYLMGSDPLRRLHWDIMDSPSDTITSSKALGPYVGEISDTVGPFAPGIEKMTPTGWWAANPAVDSARPYNTVVPNGEVNAWDAPMPPAKVVFEIQSGNGYFKDAWKTGIYYTGAAAGPYTYTAPFYKSLIPAHQAIPPFNNEFGGGYDWNSFDGVHGPYEFWKIINQPTAGAPVTGDAMHPTRVEVYSDNHGEAMVYLNGNYNLDLYPTFATNGAADIQPGYTVGNTVVRALADYPYIRTDQLILSNTVAKTWTWGGIVLGPDATHKYAPQNLNLRYSGVSRMVLASGELGTYSGNPPNEMAASSKKCIFVWVTDRDGKQSGVLNSKVEWTVVPEAGSAAEIADNYGFVYGINSYNEITQNISLTGGFLTGTGGSASPDGHMGVSRLIAPSASALLTTGPFSGKTALQALFYKFYNLTMSTTGLQPDNFAVAMIEVENKAGNSFAGGPFNVVIQISSTDFGLTATTQPGLTNYGRVAGVNMGTVSYNSNSSFAIPDPLDDAPVYGDANLDGVVNMGDVTTIERIILGLTAANVNADANITNSIDMGDVVKVERNILGY